MNNSNDSDAMYYNVPLKIDKQEDGLWRIEAPSLPVCFGDEPTLAEALYQIHEVVAMFLDLNQEERRPLPNEVEVSGTLPLYATLPVAPNEIAFYRVLPNGDRVASSGHGKKYQRRKKKLDS